MRKTIILHIALLFSFSNAQTFEWVDVAPINYQFNPAYFHGEVTTDNADNIVSARLINYLQIYGQTIYGDLKLEKRNSSGTLIWEKTIYGKVDISEIDVDGENNVICIGTFRDSVVIGTTTLFQTEVNQNSFIFKADASGNFLWVLDATSFAPQYSILTALELKTSNNILIGATNYNVNANIYEFSTAGSLVSTILQTNVGTVSDINVDISGNIWVTGFTFNGPASFNGFDTIAPFSYNEYIVKYNSAGSAQWVNFIEDITVQDFNIETDASGNGYLSGNIFMETNFGNLVANGPQWVYDFFVTKISPDGNFIWLNEIPPGNNTGDATTGNSNFLFCNSNGDTYLTGFFRGTINFGNGVTLTPIISNNDLFVLSYNTDGIIQWAKAAGSNSYDNGSSITGDENGNIYLSGFVGESSIFDTITVNGDYVNIFLAKLNSGSVVSVEDNFNEIILNNFVLYQNYPNPFNPSTNIEFTISTSPYPSPYQGEGTRERSLVTLKVYDVLGNEVATLVNEEKPAGNYEVEFSVGQDSSPDIASGIYFYTLRAGTFIQTKKMILLK
ncbi:MAG: T9SS type A sorting domain-containing protein [Ignavibacteriaceae bacterium]|nr:T9SS type A sorting domain-containing protein [Ignavibacteriaceae bacterium]